MVPRTLGSVSPTGILSAASQTKVFSPFNFRNSSSPVAGSIPNEGTNLITEVDSPSS